ncbi:MAG: hypothetical protein MJA29_03635, partial [Candidatus Omnitrophica bacterium]|nr:hypothetical protein [Candidatus Omnitrophota bacterium]
MSNLFCSRPFEWLEIQGGCAFFCCPGWSRIPGVSLKGRNVAEIWNSPAAQEFRASILDGTFKYCSPCHCIFIGQRAMPHWELTGSPVCSRDSVMDPRLHTIIRENKTILEDGPFILKDCTSHLHGFHFPVFAPDVHLPDRFPLCHHPCPLFLHRTPQIRFRQQLHKPAVNVVDLFSSAENAKRSWSRTS